MSLLERSRPPKYKSSPVRRCSCRTRAKAAQKQPKAAMSRSRGRHQALGVQGRPNAGARQDRGRSPRSRCCCIIPGTAPPPSLRAAPWPRPRRPGPRPSLTCGMPGLSPPPPQAGPPARAAGPEQRRDAAEERRVPRRPGEERGPGPAGRGGEGPSGGGAGGSDPAGSRGSPEQDARGPERSGLSPRGGCWRGEARLVRPGTQQRGSVSCKRGAAASGSHVPLQGPGCEPGCATDAPHGAFSPQRPRQAPATGGGCAAGIATNATTLVTYTRSPQKRQCTARGRAARRAPSPVREDTEPGQRLLPGPGAGRGRCRPASPRG